MNDEMRKRWADIERIYHAMISWQFVSFYVVSATAASTHGIRWGDSRASFRIGSVE